MAAIAEMRVLARCMPTHTVLAVTNGKEAEKKNAVGHTVRNWLTEGRFKDVLFFWQLKQIFFLELIVYFVYITLVCNYMLS